MKLFLRLDKGTHTLEVSPKDTFKSLKVKLTDKVGVPTYQIYLLFCGRELADNKTLEQENIIDESTIKVILKSFGDFLELSVVSQINPSLKTYIRIEEGKKVIALKEEICKFLHCQPEKQHLTAVNEKKPEKMKYLSDMDTIWTYELDHEYKIYVYYEFEGTITFRHGISSGIYKLKIKSNSTIRQIKDKIREEIQIGTVTEIYNQNNVKLSNDTSLADNRVTPADVLEIELLGDYPDRKQQQPNYTQQDIPRPKQQQQQQHQYQQTPQGPNYGYHNIRPPPIPRTKVPSQQQQHQQQQPQSYEAQQQQHQQQPQSYEPAQQHRYEQRVEQHQNYKYQNEPPYAPAPHHDQFIDSGRYEAHNPTQREVHETQLKSGRSMPAIRNPMYDKRSPFLPIQQDDWFGGGTYNPTTDEPLYQHAAGHDPRERPTSTYPQNPPVIDPDELTDAFLTQIVMAAQNEWQEIGTILLNDFQKVLEITDQKQHPFTSAMCLLREWKNRCQMHGHNPNIMPYNRNSLKVALKAVGRQDLVLQFFGQN